MADVAADSSVRSVKTSNTSSLLAGARFRFIEEDAQIFGRRRRRHAADEDKGRDAQRHADFDRVDTVPGKAALKSERPHQAAEKSRHHAPDRAFLRAAPPVQAEDDGNEEEAGDELRLFD